MSQVTGLQNSHCCLEKNAKETKKICHSRLWNPVAQKRAELQYFSVDGGILADLLLFCPSSLLCELKKINTMQTYKQPQL